MKRRSLLMGFPLLLLSLAATGTRRAEAKPRQSAHTPRGPVTTTEPRVLRGGENRPILDATHFSGKSGRSYRAAAEIPDVLDHLYCYCECEQHSGHKSLKSCFVDLHAANCGICQDEALLAHDLYRRGKSLLEIRRAVDQAYFRA